ncbi:MAG: hypothetical protein PHT33_10045, partial [bacterium]|nr:hypothetical protein [bacterium]
MTKRIPLRVCGRKDIAYTCWPVTQGVPFADGELLNGSPVRVVDDNGKVFPTQQRCLGTWSKDMKYVRWLLVDFQLSLARGADKMLFLEYECDSWPMPDNPLRIDEDEKNILIDTGAMRVLFRKADVYRLTSTDGRFLESCQIEVDGAWCEMLHDIGPLLYMIDQHGNRYDSCTAGFGPSVLLEETGPLRAEVCVRGYHSMHQGQRFCPYILRFHFFAGKSDMRIFHTFIFDQEPHSISLDAVGMKIPFLPGKILKFIVGGADKVYGNDGKCRLSLLQSSDREYAILASGNRFNAIGQSPGWASMVGSNGAVTAVIRDNWQEYPKGFVLENNDLDIGIWPLDYPECLTFTTPIEEDAVYFGGTRNEKEFNRLVDSRPGAPLNLKSLQGSAINSFSPSDLLWTECMLEKYAPGRTASYCDTGVSNGVGAAKTTEIYLRFSTRALSERKTADLAGAVHEPLIASVDPAYTCSTGAFGHFYHAGDKRFKDVD